MPYHVRITRKSDLYRDLVRLDVEEQELEARFLAPYREGHPITISGHTVAPADLERIRINETAETSDHLRPKVKAYRARSPIVGGGPSEDWYVADEGEEVTDRLITGPPGGEWPAPTPTDPSPLNADPRRVFVVHGRNDQLRDALFNFLRSIGLHPIEWSEAVKETGKASPYIGEILDVAFGNAQAVVVLMTPDDEVRLREELQHEDDPPHEKELTPQARPNVLFEAGMAMARDPDRTILVELGTLRPFSDIGGRHVLRLDDSSQRRQELANRLETAGCDVKLAGTDWHTTGNFALE